MRASYFHPFFIVLFAAFSPAHADDLNARRDRLQSLPRERRLVLQENLKTFDRLPSGERERIRALDRDLQGLPPSDRQRLYTLMRTYHDWLSALPEKTRQKIAESSPDERIKLITEIRFQENRSASEHTAPTPAIQVSSLVGEMPRQIAVELRFWFNLTPEERARILKQPNPERQRTEFEALARKSDAFKRIQNEQDRHIRKELASLRDNMKNRQSDLIARLRPFEISKNPPKDRVDSLRRASELLFLSEFTPEPVSARNLTRFEAAIPPWVRTDADALPPDAARRRLIILYRLTFPAPQELPEPSASTSKTRARSPQNSSPQPSLPPGSSNPF